MDRKTLEQLLDPLAISRAESLGLNARYIVEGYMAGEHKSAAKVLVYKDVAAFLAFQIVELHGEETLDAFMTDLGQLDGDEVEGSPIAALQKVMEDDERSSEPLKKHQVLGHAIKAFNAFVRGEHVKKISLKVNEAFPRFVAPQPNQQAA